MYVTSIISGSKVFLEKLLLRQFINNTCVDLSRKLYLKSLPKHPKTHVTEYETACVLIETILIHAYV